MDKFASDLNQEEILSRYLDTVYNKLNLDFERVADLNAQHKGIDIICKFKGIDYNIDEKAQLHYINKDLPTFTFELSYLKHHQLKKGWLLDESKMTQYYFLVTAITLHKGKNELVHWQDIKSVKITSVNKSKLIRHLINKGLTEDKLLKYDARLRQEKSFGKQEISELNKKTEGNLYFTQHLSEQPINLQLRLRYLIDSGVAKQLNC